MDKDAAGLGQRPGVEQPAPVEPARAAVRQIALNDDAALQGLVSETFSPWSNQVIVDQALIDAFAQLIRR